MQGKFPLAIVYVFTGLAASALVGCGGGNQMETTPISGKVTCNGEPLSAGTGIRLIPVAEEGKTKEGSAELGRPAFGRIGEDGTFTLRTYDEGDGAVIGRHRIEILAASKEGTAEQEETEAEEEEEEGEEDELVALPCEAPTGLFVEITSGITTVNVEMADGGKVTTE